MNTFSIDSTEHFARLTSIKVYEVAQQAQPAMIFFSTPDMPDIDDCKVLRTDLQLNDPVVEATLEVPYIRYVFRTNDMSNMHRVFAHYGKLRAGSYDFDALDCLASSNTDWLYEYQFIAIDLLRLLADNAELFAKYYLVQQLSFTVAEYDTDNRRLDIAAQNSYTNYDKLTTSLTLHLNELTIKCTDTAGKSASRHLSELSGIAEESMQCAADIQLTTYDTAGEVISRYHVLAANPDYSDAAMHVAFPAVDRTSIAGDIQVKYIIEIGTTGDVITILNRMVLTDEQLANLMLKFGTGAGLDISDLLAIIERQQVDLAYYVQQEY